MPAHRKSREKAAKKIPGTPVFFNGSLKLLLLPADNLINFIIGTAKSVPFLTCPEKDVPSILLISSVVFQSVMSSPHGIIRTTPPIKQVFFPGQSFSLLSSFCALHIQCIILPVIFPLQIWGNIQYSLPYLWILSYSINPIHQGAHSLDYNFLLLWTQILYTGKHPMGRISHFFRIPA